VREHRIGLEHHVDGTLVGRDRRHVDAVDEDPARRRPFETPPACAGASSCRSPKHRAGRKSPSCRCRA
jgi:hypothetical protein